MSVVDVNNSSTTLLTAGSTFTGTWYNVLHFTCTTVSIVVDEDSATNGLKMQWSSDATNVDHERDETITGTGNAFDYIHFCKYFRIVYVNGSTDMGTMRLQTIHHKHGVKETAPSVGTGESGSATTEDLGIVDPGNSTSTLLAGDAVFTGVWFNVLQYSEMTLLINTDQASATNGLSMEFSSDGTNIDRQKQVTFSGVLANQAHTLTHIAKFFRVVYTNGSTIQGHMRLQVIHHKSKNKQLTSTITENITDSVDVQNVRSVIVGRKGDGTYSNVKIDSESHLLIGIDSPITAFGDLRNAELTPVVHQTFIYNINSRIWTEDTTNGTADVNASRLRLQTSAATSSHAEVQSVKRVKYRAGLGVVVRFTAIFTTGVANSNQYIGIGDGTDGFFFGYNGATFGVMHRNNSVDTWVAQTAWNLDVCDGTSVMPNLVHTNGNVFEISYQYLGYGAITFYVEDPTNGHFTPVHRIQYANANTAVSLSHPTLPLCARVENSTNDSNIILYSGSLSALIEGKNIPTHLSTAKDNTKTGITTLTNVITIRNKTTFASITNREIVYPEFLSVAVDGTKNARIEIYLNATLGGSPSYTDIGTNTSIVDFDVAGTTISNGTLVTALALAKEDSGIINLEQLGLFLDPGDTLTVGCVSSASTECSVALDWLEDI